MTSYIYTFRVHVERKSEASTSEAGLFFSAIQSSDGGTYTCNATINNKTESANFVLRTYSGSFSFQIL